MNNFELNTSYYFDSYNLANTITEIFRDHNIRKDVISLYKILVDETNVKNGCLYNRHIMNLYGEWLMDLKKSNPNGYTIYERNNFIDYSYLMDVEKTDFYKLVFSAQTYFCMVLKLLSASVFKQIECGNDFSMTKISWSDLSSLFLNFNQYFDRFTDGLFEVDYYVWFVSVARNNALIINKIANNIISKLKSFNTFKSIFYSKTISEQLIHFYNFLIPICPLKSCKMINGEDFLVELDYSINLFESCNKELTWKAANKISSQLTGFTSDKITLLITKSSYMMALLYRTPSFNLNMPLKFKIYPFLSRTFKDINFNPKLGSSKITLETYVGEFVIPLSGSIDIDIDVFKYMSSCLDNKKGFSVFWERVCNKFNNLKFNKNDFKVLYEKLMLLRTPIQYDFWSVYLRKTITPFLIE